MRPNTTDAVEPPVYECLGCGRRTTAPETTTCESCDLPLRNLSVSRDL